jgi:Phage integrase family/Arm DNA-binding domain
MAERKLFTDRYLKALAPAPKGQRVERWDSRVPGFGIRIGDAVDTSRPGKASKVSFILFSRFAPGTAPTRRVIGSYGAITLERAREIAGEWRSMIDKGVDPAAVEADKIKVAKREAEQRQQHSFGTVAEAFITDKLARERRGKAVERNLRAVFIRVWGDRQISDITDLDVLAIINAKKRTAPAQARALLTMIKRMFNWAVDARVYGLKASPCDRLKSKKIVGEIVPRQRRLTDDELFAQWRATERMSVPVGAVYQILMLTALRLNEAAKISRPEISDGIVTIPASRMKGRESKAREHLVPLPPLARELIAQQMNINQGPFIFSYNNGSTALTMTSKIKNDLDRRMLRTLKAMARQRGDDPRKVTLTPWTNHDIRRTVRSGLSALRIPQNVAEAALAHVPPGIIATYNVHDFIDEKREALEAWSRRLAIITNPDKPSNVIALRSRR